MLCLSPRLAAESNTPCLACRSTNAAATPQCVPPPALPAGSCIATGGSDGTIKLWDLRAGRLVQYYEAHQGAVTDLCIHPCGSFLLSSSLDGTLKVGDRRPCNAEPQGLILN